MRADNIALRKTSFKIYDYQFNDLIARVKHLKEPALVGYGVDVESGELVPYLFADPNNAISAIGCLSTSNELMWFVPPLNGYETTLDKDGSNQVNGHKRELAIQIDQSSFNLLDLAQFGA